MGLMARINESEHIKDFRELLDGDWSLASRLAALNRAFCIVELDPDETVVHANRRFLQLTGYKRAELIGKPHAVLCMEWMRDSEEYRNLWSRLRSGRPVQGEQLRRRADGAAIWMQAAYAPVLNPQGKVERILKVAMDVTDAHVKAAEAESTLEAIGRSCGVITLAEDGTIVDTNTNFAHSLGYEEEHLIGLSHSDLCEEGYTETREYRQFWARLRDGEAVSGTYARRSRSGETINLQASYSPIFGPDGQITKILGIAYVVPEGSSTETTQ